MIYPESMRKLLGGISILVAILLLSTVPSHGQKKGQLHRKQKLADQYFLAQMWPEALNEYDQVILFSPLNPEINFRLGICYFNSIAPKRSLPYFQKAEKLGHHPDSMEYYLGRSYHFNMKLDTAIMYYRRFLSKMEKGDGTHQNLVDNTEKHIQHCRNAREILKNKLELRIENVGEPINTHYAEYVPLTTANEKGMFFTSRRPNTTGGGVDENGFFLEDVYYSKKEGEDWGTPTNNLPFNTRGHDACVGFSPDGKNIFIYRSVNGGDLFISENKNGNWTSPTPIKGSVNTEHWESSASMTSDGKLLYFSSDKPGGIGGSDIYVAKRLESGEWGEVKNLGSIINTEEDEDAPIIHSDGKTLFFSSRGNLTMGGFDVFSSTILKDSNEWTLPKNIGYPVNTPGDDIYFSLVADGSRGFFSSYRDDSFGEKDIYVIKRPGSIPTKFLMKLKLEDEFQKKNISASIKVIDEETGEEVVFWKADSSKSNYSGALDFEKKYKVEIAAPGYDIQDREIKVGYQADIFQYVMNIVPKEEEIIALVDSAYKEEAPISKSFQPVIHPDTALADAFSPKSGGYNLDVIYLTRKDNHDKVAARTALFGFDKANVKLDAMPSLNDLATFLLRNPDLLLIISGHTDSLGSANYNKKLSKKRANAIKKYLKSQGVPKDQLLSEAFGEALPITANDPHGQLLNRRTDFLILEVHDNKWLQSPFKEYAKENKIKVNPKEGYESPFEVVELLPVAVNFEYGKYRLTNYSKNKLFSLSNFVNQSPYKVVIAGYTDSEEKKDDRYVQLDEKRMWEVKRFFLSHDIAKEKIILKHGEELKAYFHIEKLPEGIQKRRVQFFLLKE
jgi:outer membrane protein OmpA-like peptidoglycan-associated protein